MKPDSKNRLPYIDGLRAVAALWVLLTHAWVFTDSPALGITVHGVTIVLGSIAAVGHVGVNLFLVLSGFCLAWPFFSNPSLRGRTTALDFWKRRVQRIVPAYYASMVFVCVLLLAEGALAARHLWPVQPATFGIGDIVSHMLFLQNLSPSQAVTINNSYWSLALEFQLYFLFPLLLEAMRRFGVWRVAGVILILQLAYRLSLEAALSPQILSDMDFVLPKAVFGRWFDFVAGMAAASVVAAMARGERPARRVWMAPAVAAISAAFAMFCRQGFSEGVMDLLWGIGFSSLVCWAAETHSVAQRVLSMRWLTAIGVMSYSLYLIHLPLMEAAGRWIRYHYGIRSGSAFFVELGAGLGVIIVAALFYLAFERPALNYFADRRRLKAAAGAPAKGAIAATPLAVSMAPELSPSTVSS